MRAGQPLAAAPGLGSTARRPPAIAMAGLAVAGLAIMLYVAAAFLTRDRVRMFNVAGAGRPAAVAVLFSGDLGIRVGMGPYIGRALAGARIPVFGIGSPAVFGTHRSRGEVDAIVAGAIREAMVRTGASRVVVVGQSFGADVAGAGLADLPPDLRPHVAGLVLVVPGRSAYFRTDPTGLSYRGAPDADLRIVRAIDWTPLVCIHGALEADSLCPLLNGANVHVIALPGGHLLRRDHELLVRTILHAIRPFHIPIGETLQ
jgi:type IV secretory pathway VirJ component